jgi:hypothetical protein
MFRFTIRDVIWLTIVAALVVAWALDHRYQAAERARWKNRLEFVAAYFRPMGWSIYTDTTGVGIGNTNTGHDHTYSQDPF